MEEKDDIYYDYVKSMYDDYINSYKSKKRTSIEISDLKNLDEYVSERELEKIMESLLEKNPSLLESVVKKIRVKKIQKLNKNILRDGVSGLTC